MHGEPGLMMSGFWAWGCLSGAMVVDGVTRRDRVLCVFTTGQAWQFKPYKWTDPKDLFRNGKLCAFDPARRSACFTEHGVRSKTLR